MKLDGARLHPLTLTLRRPLLTARGEVREREGFVLELRAGGLVGMGEATPHPFAAPGELARTAKALEQVCRALVGRAVPAEVDAVEALLAELSLAESPAARHTGEALVAEVPSSDVPPARHVVEAQVNEVPSSDVPAAQQAVESALLDLLGQRRGATVAALLADAPRTAIAVNALLLEASPDLLASEARRAVAAGFRTLKVKVGLPDDVRRLQAVRAAVGETPRIRIDANGAWSREEARSHLARLAELDLELCEQPVAAGDHDGLRALRDARLCDIAADESLTSERVAASVTSAADLLVVRPMVLGGVLPAMRVARAAHARGVGAYVACGLDGVVARAAAAHLAAALPGGDWAHGLGVGALFEEEPAGQRYAPSEGRITLPTGAGLGLEALR